MSSYGALDGIRQSSGSMNRRTIIITAVVASLLIVFIVVIAVAAQPSDSSGGGATCPADFIAQPPVILVSLDGFRASYLSRGLTPTIQGIADEGVTTPYMIPSYPTVTFPNHYTIVTGLYPESHGIIANSFYNPETGTVFSIGNPITNESYWWLGEPMWNTLTRQGKKSASYFWVGSDASVDGQHPTYWYPYDGSVPYNDRVDQVLEWLALPEEDRPVWTALYFDEPDKTGHKYGPDSPEVNEKLQLVDSTIQRLVDGLKASDLLDCVNIILVADHGMASGGPGFVIQLQDYIPDVAETTYPYQGAFARLNPKNDTDDVRYEMMRNLSCKRPDMRQYEKKGLPKRFHFSNSDRIESIVLDLDPGRYGVVNSDWYSLGNHGYDNYFSSMHALFIARGPSFKKGVEVAPFQNIHLYNLMCFMTGVEPAPNNGTWGALNSLLLNPAPEENPPTGDSPSVAEYPEEPILSNRLNASGCPGDLTEVEPWLSSLNMKAEELAELEAQHLPWGIPIAANNSNADVTLLYHADHVTGYSERLKVPLWTGFSLTVVDGLPAEGGEWSSDVRLETSAKCSDYEDMDNTTVMATLFPPEYSSNKSLERVPYMVSNAVPSTEQQQKWWRELLDHYVLKWLGEGQLNLVMGPVYDLNADSIADNFTSFEQTPKVPSDWFAVVTRCRTGGLITSCNATFLESRAFMLPTIQHVGNCMESSAYLLEFSCTLKDVELATGFILYPSLPVAERTRILTTVHNTLW